MTFYYIQDNTSKPTTGHLLEEACRKNNIACRRVDPDAFNEVSEQQLTNSDLLYRVTVGDRAELLEQHLLLGRPTTFHSTMDRGFSKIDNVIQATLLHQYYKLPIPKTVYVMPRGNLFLEEQVEYVGGFPVIVKAKGGSHGVGVMKIDSLDSLRSVIDYIGQDSLIILRQFISTSTSARLIVLGGQVIDSIEYHTQGEDFRSNYGEEPIVAAKKFSSDVEGVAQKAVSVLGLEFGGVDVIMDSEGNPYLLEVNFPCYFGRAQLTTGVDIASMMIDYLIKKSRVSTSLKTIRNDLRE